MTYKQTSIAAAFIFGCLFLVLVFVTGLIFWLFQMPESEVAAAMIRRAGFLMLGIALIAFFSRNAPESEARTAICLGLMISLAGLGLLGIVEFIRGIVGPGIFVAVLTEFAFMIAYGRLARGQKP